MVKLKIRVCVGSSCFSRESDRNISVIKAFLARKNLVKDVDYELDGGLCLGHCADGPNVVVNGDLYHHVTPGVMEEILRKYLPD